MLGPSSPILGTSMTVEILKAKSVAEDLTAADLESEALESSTQEGSAEDQEEAEGQKLLSTPIPDSGEDEDDEEDSGVLTIYKKECLSCPALVPFLKQKNWKFPSCHFSKGNEQCPASSLMIQLFMPAEEICLKFQAAKDNGDASRLASLYSSLSQKPEWVQKRILGELRKRNI